MAIFVETDLGYVNTDAIASMQQQVGGAYRVRWIDGMIQVITQSDGDAISLAIDEAIEKSRIEMAAKATTRKTRTTKKSA